MDMVGGWAYPSKKYEFVNWDDDIPNMGENKSHVPNHQPAMYIRANLSSAIVMNFTMPHQESGWRWHTVMEESVAGPSQ